MISNQQAINQSISGYIIKEVCKKLNENIKCKTNEKNELFLEGIYNVK